MKSGRTPVSAEDSVHGAKSSPTELESCQEPPRTRRTWEHQLPRGLQRPGGNLEEMLSRTSLLTFGDTSSV